jgi:hypothetical protein
MGLDYRLAPVAHRHNRSEALRISRPSWVTRAKQLASVIRAGAEAMRIWALRFIQTTRSSIQRVVRSSQGLRELRPPEMAVAHWRGVCIFANLFRQR